MQQTFSSGIVRKSLTREEKNRIGQNSLFQLASTYIFIIRGEIHLMTWFAREQLFKTYFCEVDLSDGKTAKRNVWSPKFAIREMKESEVEATELGAAEDVGGEGHVHGWWLADEDEVLDAPAARNRDHSPSLRSWTPKKQ
jgi:hypothetical protein